MSPQRQLRLFRAVFIVFIIVSSAQTIAGAARDGEVGHGAHAMLLGGIEIVAALLFWPRRLQAIGGALLLAVFLIAAVLTTLSGGIAARFLFFAATVLVILGLDRHHLALKSP